MIALRNSVGSTRNKFRVFQRVFKCLAELCVGVVSYGEYSAQKCLIMPQPGNFPHIISARVFATFLGVELLSKKSMHLVIVNVMQYLIFGNF